MTRDEYCIKVCGGKCCYLDGVRCPMLKNGACSIYKERYGPGAPEFQLVATVLVQHIGKPAKKQPFFCWQIEKLLERNLIPEDVRKGCVYAHPELLEKYSNGSQTDSSKLA